MNIVITQILYHYTNGTYIVNTAETVIQVLHILQKSFQRDFTSGTLLADAEGEGAGGVAESFRIEFSQTHKIGNIGITGFLCHNKKISNKILSLARTELGTSGVLV